jgi:hypothetical protein
MTAAKQALRHIILFLVHFIHAQHRASLLVFRELCVHPFELQGDLNTLQMRGRRITVYTDNDGEIRIFVQGNLYGDRNCQDGTC